MTEYIELACLSVMELVKQFLAYRIFFHRKQIRSLRHIIIYFLIVIIIQEILLWNFGNTLALPVILLTGLIIPLYFLDGTRIRKILEYIISAFSFRHYRKHYSVIRHTVFSTWTHHVICRHVPVVYSRCLCMHTIHCYQHLSDFSF